MTEPRQPFPLLKIDAWPPAIAADWCKADQPTVLFDDPNPLLAWRAATRHSTEKSFGMYLGWLQKRGEAPHTSVQLLAQTSEEQIRRFILAYQPGRAPLSVAGAVRGVAYALRVLAPPDGLLWLTKLAHRMTNIAPPSRSKANRIVDAPVLVALGERLMALGQEIHVEDWRKGTVMYRDGLAILMLIYRPLRLRNFADLRLGQSLLETDTGWRIIFNGTETKKSRPIDVPLPDAAVDPLIHYLREIRPILLRGKEDHGYLWVTRRGTPLPQEQFSIRIPKLTMEYLGRSISPHLFRDCAATEIAHHAPKLVGITKDVLGHAILISSQTYYNQAGSVSATRKYSNLINGLRRKPT